MHIPASHTRTFSQPDLTGKREISFEKLGAEINNDDLNRMVKLLTKMYPKVGANEMRSRIQSNSHNYDGGFIVARFQGTIVGLVNYRILKDHRSP